MIRAILINIAIIITISANAQKRNMQSVLSAGSNTFKYGKVNFSCKIGNYMQNYNYTKQKVKFSNPFQDATQIKTNIKKTEKIKPEIKVYPNPCKEKLFINLRKTSLSQINSVSLQIFNILGHEITTEIKKEIQNGCIILNLDNIKEGQYFIRLLNKNEMLASFVILHYN